MPEQPTTLVGRAKAAAGSHKAKLAGVGGGGIGAVMVLVYQLFVTKDELADYKYEAARKLSVQWQKLMDYENALDAVRMDIVRLQTINETKTNRP